MALTKIFAALLFIGLGLGLILLNMSTTSEKQATSAEDSYDCRLDCNGECTISKRMNCGGTCIQEIQETCTFHQQDDDYY